MIKSNLVPVSTLDTYIIKGRAFTDEYSTVYLNGKPLCDDSWDLNDGHVICKMMGFTGAESIRESFNLKTSARDWTSPNFFAPFLDFGLSFYGVIRL